MSETTDCVQAYGTCVESKSSSSRFESDRQVFHRMVNLDLKLKLVEVNRSMTKDDHFFFRYQMERQLSSTSTKDELTSLELFSLLIRNKLITSNNVKIISDVFFRMKRHGLISILERGQTSQSKTNQDRKEIKPSFKSQPNLIQETSQTLTDPFILRLCTEDIVPRQLMQLGVHGFKLPIVTIARAQYDSRSSLDASIAVFTAWKNSAPHPSSTSWIRNGTIPSYTMRGLKQALKDSQMNHILIKYPILGHRTT